MIYADIYDRHGRLVASTVDISDKRARRKGLIRIQPCPDCLVLRTVGGPHVCLKPGVISP